MKYRERDKVIITQYCAYAYKGDVAKIITVDPIDKELCISFKGSTFWVKPSYVRPYSKLFTKEEQIMRKFSNKIEKLTENLFPTDDTLKLFEEIVNYTIKHYGR